MESLSRVHTMLPSRDPLGYQGCRACHGSPGPPPTAACASPAPAAHTANCSRPWHPRTTAATTDLSASVDEDDVSEISDVGADAAPPGSAGPTSSAPIDGCSAAPRHPRPQMKPATPTTPALCAANNSLRTLPNTCPRQPTASHVACGTGGPKYLAARGRGWGLVEVDHKNTAATRRRRQRVPTSSSEAWSN